ncbi:hypothetical protein GGR57DRAFT_69301 [Xylariaceae sp. FL1272]|nr:hypothetical protein GGR57DRAFT_69301 [Xylariaceae sp. FL1272]
MLARRVGTSVSSLKYSDTAIGAVLGVAEMVEATMNKYGEHSTLGLVRLLVSHRPSQYTKAQVWEQIMNFSERIRSEATGLTKPQGEVQHYIQDIARRLIRKTFFAISNGRFGIGVAGVEEGDILIMCPHMCNVMVLREQSPKSTNRTGQYKIVGTAIVNGIVQNDCLDEGLVQEIAQRDLEEFVIW